MEDNTMFEKDNRTLQNPKQLEKKLSFLFTK